MRGIFGLIAVIIAIAVFALLVTIGLKAASNPKGLANEVLSRMDSPLDERETTYKTFIVRQGETAGQIADRLKSEGLIADSLTFRLRVEIEVVAGDLSAGEYELSPSMKPSQILETLVKGRIKSGPLLTIPEGWRSEEIAERLERRGVGTADEFMRVVKAGRSASPLLSSRPAGASLEGYLFPDSYALDEKSTPENIARRMVEQFERQFTPEMVEKVGKTGLTIHQIVTLASIIEREAIVSSERPLMAGVFYNRLRLGMRIQSDPTVQYALIDAQPELQKKYGWWKKGLTIDDLNVDSPYNSYKYPGLPPGPICNPGLASIKAAIEPANTDYIYFVAKPDGSHAFAKTLEEHNDNVAKYRQ